MVKTVIDRKDEGMEWIDIVSPGHEEIISLAEKYGLAPESVEDVLQPEHLPKYERLKNYAIIIFRMYNVKRESEADTVKELTNKLVIFISEKYILTVHKYSWDALEKIAGSTDEFENPNQVLCSLSTAVLQSFDEPATRLSRTIDYYEELVFLKERKVPLLKSLYFLKRKVDVIRSILLHTGDVIEYLHPEGSMDAATRNIRDLYVKQLSVFNNLADNTTHLLNIYFNISSQRTNDTIRVLTIFSVFFMPLTFIVGVYGMNFDFMPELRFKWGYAAVWIVMLVVILCIYIWFKRKKWL
jgi:magnesium transporter